MNINELISNIAKKLKKLRKERGFSQEELVSLIGKENISLRSYKSYENEKSKRLPLLDKLMLLSTFYDCPIDNFLHNRNCIYSDSYSKKDCFHRLVDLIYSLVLLPEKNVDKKSAYYGKYCFYAYDTETSLFLDKLLCFAEEQNYKYEYLNIKYLDLINHFHKIINEIPNLNEDWTISKKRLEKIASEAKLDFEKYHKERIQNIKSKRSIQKDFSSNN